MRLYVTVMHPGSRTTPLTDEARAEFAAYAAAIVRQVPAIRDVIVGERAEPQPLLAPAVRARRVERGARGVPRAARANVRRPQGRVARVDVYGGAVSPRGTDRPQGIRPTHSPTTFIQGLGVAYRASGRTRPVMDAFAIHVYADNSSIPPTSGAPARHDDRRRRLRQARRASGRGIRRDRAARIDAADPLRRVRRRNTDPGEQGRACTPDRADDDEARVARGRRPTTTAGARARVLPAERRPACCIFLSRDERARAAWQSGVYYVGRHSQERASRASSSALDRATGGSVARCPGLELSVRTTYLRFGTRQAAKRGIFRVSFRCDLDCRYWVRLENAATHSTKLVRRGRAEVGELVQSDLGTRRLAPGAYRYTIRLDHPVNPAPPTLRRGPVFRLP